MNPIYDFKGQVALVTGAAKGMGLATARMFAESGASVVMADLDGDLAANEAERLVQEGGTAIGIACDVADEAQSGRDGRSRGRRVRPARHGIQQCRHPGAAVGCRRRAD
jgi:NAD(P)-dependent dehydrogenase (short-subunit alcohol dehydrogenase family)